MVGEFALVAGNDDQTGLRQQFRKRVREALANPVVFGATGGVFER